MSESWKSPLFFLSLGMNIAFLFVLGFFALPGIEVEYFEEREHEKYDRDDHKAVSSRRKKRKKPGWYLYRKKIGVSDTQWQNIRHNMGQFHRNALKICRKISGLRNEILTLIEDPEPNRERIRKKESQIIRLRRKKHAMFLDYMSAKKNHLTRAQQEKFFAMLRGKKHCGQHARFLERK
jgi:Spy/CpxP family protein refolding chaperone